MVTRLQSTIPQVDYEQALPLYVQLLDLQLLQITSLPVSKKSKIARQALEQSLQTTLLLACQHKFQRPLRPAYDPIVQTQMLYLDWAISFGGLAKFRSACDVVLGVPSVSVEVYHHILQLELQQPQLDRIRIASLFEQALATYGTQDEDLWILFIKFQTRTGNVSAVNTTYWRAMKALKETATFVTKYNAIK
eukprot:TRINITY_DN4134_c0_g2_i6.p1 TRINITY_DN4134_c0_g2~~TRINITY_DN4134_c0_g2_i6.p1  ORF type:complete len:192 (-),score=42.86 TRINITY_DN4134_c0_g2_i6:23-598(-)